MTTILLLWLSVDVGFLLGLWWARRMSEQRAARIWANAQAQIVQDQARKAAWERGVHEAIGRGRGWDMPPADLLRFIELGPTDKVA